MRDAQCQAMENKHKDNAQTKSVIVQVDQPNDQQVIRLKTTACLPTSATQPTKKNPGVAMTANKRSEITETTAYTFF
jgi:hypothetical protein